MSRVPPHDTDAEWSVLGACMLDRAAADEVLSLLAPEDFYAPKHALIFTAMVALAHDEEPIDETTVSARLRAEARLADIGGSMLLAQITETVPTAANALHYARIVRDRAVRRRLIAEAERLALAARDSDETARVIADQGAAAISAAAAQGSDQPAVSSKELVTEAFKRIEAARGGQGVRGLETGYTELDAKLGGLLPSNLLILAARPSMGKTALAMNIAQGVAERGRRVLVFSLEMNRDEVADRMIASAARVDLNRIRAGALGSADWPRLAAGVARLYEQPIHVHDKGDMTVLELRSLARRHRAQHGLDLVVVDYLQLMSDSRDHGREREIADISRGLKGLAKELNIPVIALSQLSRACEARDNKRPRLSDLRESGAIEQDADAVLFVYRDEYYNARSEEPGVAEIIIGKNRNGSTEGVVKLRWFGQFTRFDNLARAA